MSKKDSLGNAITIAALLFGVVLTAVLFSMVGSGSREPQAQTKPSVEKQAEQESAAPKISKPTLPPGQAIVGGVQRPASDVKLGNNGNRISVKAPPKPEGAPPEVQRNANAEVKEVYSALAEKRNPELLSSNIITHNFDKTAFEANPEAYAKQYASRPEPGRVFAPAQPADGVAAIKPIGSKLHRVQQGESVRLKVESAPNAPVTFTSFGMGQFVNLLSSQTIVANAEGVAEAVFTATSGTKKQVRILAASPITTEQVAFTVSVKLPQDNQ